MLSGYSDSTIRASCDRRSAVRSAASAAAAVPVAAAALEPGVGNGTHGDFLLTYEWGDYATCKEYCEGMGFQLPCITSAAENAEFYDVVATNAAEQSNYGSWIAYTNANADSEWRWEDGCASTYANWDSEQPDGEEVVQHGAEQRVELKWGDCRLLPPPPGRIQRSVIIIYSTCTYMYVGMLYNIK